MLSVYCLAPGGLKRIERDPGAPLPEDAVWLDLLEPTPEEERLVEQRLGRLDAAAHWLARVPKDSRDDYESLAWMDQLVYRRDDAGAA